MIQIIEEKEFWSLFWNSESQIIELQWKRSDKRKELPDEEFKNFLLHFIKILTQYKAKGFLADAQEYHIPIPPLLQEWHDQEIIPQYISLGIKRVAFVVSQSNFDELITHLSLEQTFDEYGAQEIETYFYNSLEEARALFQNISE